MCLFVIIVHRVADDTYFFDGGEEEEEEEEDERIFVSARYCICSRPKLAAPLIACKSKQRVCNGCVTGCVKYSV